MLRKLHPLFALCSLLLILNACGSLRIKAPLPYENPAEIKKIALVNTMVLPIKQPKAPVADASTFNKKTEALAKEVNQLMKTKADQYYQTLGRGMQMQLGTEVVYGEALKDAERYERTIRDIEKEPLTLKGAKPFQHIFVGEGGFNTLMFSEGQVGTFIEESPRMRSISRSLVRDLEADAVAFSYAQMEIDGVVAFGAKAKAKLITNIYIFNDRGEMIGHGYGETKAKEMTGDDIEQYREVMNQYPDLQNLVLTEMVAAAESEEEEEE